MNDRLFATALSVLGAVRFRVLAKVTRINVSVETCTGSLTLGERRIVVANEVLEGLEGHVEVDGRDVIKVGDCAEWTRDGEALRSITGLLDSLDT
jgi:hypothetical protein